MAQGTRLSFVGLMIVLAPSVAAAQQPLTLDAAVSAAVAHNATLRASRAHLDEAAAEARRVRAGAFPRLSLSESWQRGDQPAFVFGSLLAARRFTAANFAVDALNHPDPIGFFRTSLGAEQVIFDGGRQRSASAVANLQAAVARADYDDAQAALAVETTRVFGRIVTAQAARRAAEAGLEAAREDLTVAERRRDAGLVTDADVLSLVVHVATLQERSIQAEGDAASAGAELNRLMGAAIDAPVHVVEPVSPAANTADGGRAIATLFAQAAAARPEIARSAARERIAEATRDAARAAWLPRVAAQAALDLSGTRVNERARSWVIGGEAQWTISTAGAEAAAVRAAAAATARARAEADAARASVELDVVTAVRRLETARAREDVGRTMVDQARESQRIIRDRFDAGLAPVADVLRASSAVLEAESRRVEAQIDATVATAMLRRAVGRDPEVRPM
jgi:outer membrane protein TolC